MYLVCFLIVIGVTIATIYLMLPSNNRRIESFKSEWFTSVKGNEEEDVTITSNSHNSVQINDIVSQQMDNKSTSVFDNYNHYENTQNPDNVGTNTVQPQSGVKPTFGINDVMYYGPYGSVAITSIKNNTNVLTVLYGGKKTIFISNNASSTPSGKTATKSIYYSKDGGTAYITATQTGNYAVNVRFPNGNVTIFKTKSSILGNTHSPTIFQNKPVSDILNEKDDLYILKSRIIPPICPKCPQPIISVCETNNSAKQHKKNLPYPVVTNYSTFGT